MQANSLKMIGLFIGMVGLFAAKTQAEPGNIEEKFRLQFEAADAGETGPLMAARDSDSAVDRAFGKMDKKRAKQQKYKYWYLLPFGIPQFTEGYRGIGSALAVGQVGSLALYYDRLKKVQVGNQAASDVTRGVNPAQAGQNPFIVNFLNQNEKNVKDAQKEQQIFLFTFIGLYGFSVYEALYDPLDYRKIDSLRKKRSKDRDRNDEGRGDDRGDDRDRDRDRDRNDDDDEAALDTPSRGRRSNFGFMVLPSDKKYEIALGWQTTLP